MTPVVSVRRTFALKSGERPIRNPRRNEPRMLTMSVPAGKAGPNALDAQRAVRYLAPVPSAPPRQISAKRNIAILSEAKDLRLDRRCSISAAHRAEDPSSSLRSSSGLKSSNSDSLLSRHQALRSLLDRVDGHHLPHRERGIRFPDRAERRGEVDAAEADPAADAAHRGADRRQR